MIFEHKNKIYSITDEVDGKYIVIRASWLPNGKKLVEEMRKVEAGSKSKVQRLIRLGRYEKFEKIEKM